MEKLREKCWESIAENVNWTGSGKGRVTVEVPDDFEARVGDWEWLEIGMNLNTSLLLLV